MWRHWGYQFECDVIIDIIMNCGCHSECDLTVSVQRHPLFQSVLIHHVCGHHQSDLFSNDWFLIEWEGVSKAMFLSHRQNSFIYKWYSFISSSGDYSEGYLSCLKLKRGAETALSYLDFDLSVYPAWQEQEGRRRKSFIYCDSSRASFISVWGSKGRRFSPGSYGVGFGHLRFINKL